MINSISFLSNFTIRTKARNIANQEKFWMFTDFSSNMVSNHDRCTLSISLEKDKKPPYLCRSTANLSVPDIFDNTVENFCKCNGIHYKKLKIPKVMTP